MANYWLIFLFTSSAFFPLLAEEEKSPADISAPPCLAQDGYTINYNTVSIVEYIRFASKICNTNFIFNESDLPFTVTVVSDAPATADTVMATLIQTLRIHGLSLLEEGHNLVIHKSPNVRQPATLVFGDEKTGCGAAIVTRIFRLKNASVDSIAAIVKPMISETAAIEVSRETRQLILTDVTPVVDKIAALIENLDSPHTSLEIRNFETKFNKPEYLIQLASQIMNPIAQGNPFILVPQSLANAIFLVSTPELNEKAVSVLTSLDTPPKKVLLSERKIRSDDIFVVKLEHRPGNELLQSLKQIAQNLQESGILETDLIETMDSAKWISETNSLMFVGSPESNVKVREFIRSLDAGEMVDVSKPSFFVYRPLYRNLDEIQKSMLEVAENIQKTNGPEDNVVVTIRGQKSNPLTNTILYAGDATTFTKIKDLLATVDSPTGKGKRVSARTNFFVYKIQSANPEKVKASIEEFASGLEKSGIAEEGIVDAIRSVNYIEEAGSLVFVASDEVLKRLQEIMPQFDVEASKSAIQPSTQFLAYKPKYQKGEVLARLLKETLHNLKANLSDAALIHSLESMKWVKNTSTLLFTGDPGSLKRVDELIGSMDLPVIGGVVGQKGAGYFVYKLQNPNGQMVEESLDSILENMKLAGMKDTLLVKALENMRYVKETNSLLITGEPTAIEEAKDLIAKYDSATVSRDVATNTFFIYRPQRSSPAKIEAALHEIAANLKRANLSDPSLLGAISTAKFVDSTNSFVFTGTPEAIGKVQALLKEIDSSIPSEPIQVGQSTFLLYKLKTTNASQITSSLKSISSDLRKAGSVDTDFLKSIDSMKFVKETNSLMFTGPEGVLTRVQALVEKFDIPSASTPSMAAIEKDLLSTGPTEFIVYKPQSLSLAELEMTLHDFGENLKASGLNDPGLFYTLQTMKVNEKTHSIIFTGDAKSLDRIRFLLKEFDVQSGILAGVPGEQMIQSIDNTSFLVYKLEFHKGDEIVNALHQIAKDLQMNNTSVNQGLLNSINSIQWIEVTNSLLCSGDQDTLTRLRELVKSLDVALKQVFIEVLVIETTLTNAISFGLDWGGKVKYLNKFSGSFNNFTPTTGSSVDPLMTGFATGLNSISATRTPKPSDIPFGQAFDMGVIGDIITHKGQTFLSLGSLLNALQSDIESTIVMTPKIIAQDSKTATIFSGSNVPFAGSFISNSSSGQSSTIQTSNLEYRDIGMNLSITPVLGNSNIITLDINLDNSTQVGPSSGATFNFDAKTATGITTTRTTMHTTVHVPNRNFLILSGMVNNASRRTKTGIPCLGGIPILGAAFSTNNDEINNSNVVIFLRPTIIQSIEDMKKLSCDQEEFFRSQAGTPTLEHNYDEAMEIIKSLDDE